MVRVVCCRKTFRWLFLVLGLLSFSSLAHTETVSTSQGVWPSKVKVGGEYRLRVESQFNYNLDSSTPDDDTFMLMRTRAYLDLHPADNLQFFGMFQDSETIEQGPAKVKTADRHKFYQGYMVFRENNAPLHVMVKVGRQEITFGDQRLIGNNGWGNLGRSFDAAIIQIENKKFWLAFFGGRIRPVTTEFELAGAYGHLKNFPGGEAEPYVIYAHSDHAGINTGSLNLVTVGSRISAKFQKNFDYGVEGAYQTGKSSSSTISAGAVHSHLGYTFPVSFSPRLGLEYNFASGDSSPTAGKLTAFNNLFPTNHDKYGYIDFFSWKNIHDIRANVSARPFSFMKVSADYHAFFLPEPVNGIAMAGGATLRAGSATASHFAGQEVDVLFKFEPIKYFDASVGYSAFFPGEFFSDTGTSDTAHFVYSQLTAKY